MRPDQAHLRVSRHGTDAAAWQRHRRRADPRTGAPGGAERHQRTAERRGLRNGSRDRLLATPAGDIQQRIPRFRTGSFFPSLLEPRRRMDWALWAGVMEACVSGVSIRKVDELVAALGCESGISKSEVSCICQGLDTQVQETVLNRPLEFSRYPYVYLVATYLHGGDQARKQVVPSAVIVAVGITATGRREVLGIEVGESEDKTSWTAFLRRLRERGLRGVQLAALPRALCPHPPVQGAQGQPGHGGCCPDGAGQGGRPRLPGIPHGALAQDLEQQEE